jgi:single-stranded-DNA-specific exonuclease recJ
MINESPKTNDLEESTLLKKLNEQMLLEKKFNYSQFQELKSWMDSQQGK